MAELPYRAVFSDMDGTLLDREHRIPPRNRAAIARLQALGIPFCLASGRPFFSMLDYHRDIGGGDMISMNGALILDERQRPLRSVTFSDDELCHIQRFLPRNHPDFSINYYHYEDWFSDNAEHPSVYFEQRITGRTPRLDTQNLRSVHKILICADADSILALQHVLREALPGYGILRSHRCYLEVIHPESGKGNAMAFLAGRYGVPLSACIAFGDNDNDLDMFQRAGLAVAMDNAEDSVKAQAHRVTAAHHECGFADIIDSCFP